MIYPLRKAKDYIQEKVKKKQNFYKKLVEDVHNFSSEKSKCVESRAIVSLLLLLFDFEL